MAYDTIDDKIVSLEYSTVSGALCICNLALAGITHRNLLAISFRHKLFMKYMY